MISAAGVDRAAGVALAVAADAVEVLEAEADRVDQLVAALARARCAECAA